MTLATRAREVSREGGGLRGTDRGEHLIDTPLTEHMERGPITQVHIQTAEPFPEALRLEHILQLSDDRVQIDESVPRGFGRLLPPSHNFRHHVKGKA